MLYRIGVLRILCLDTLQYHTQAYYNMRCAIGLSPKPGGAIGFSLHERADFDFHFRITTIQNTSALLFGFGLSTLFLDATM